jgi:crotonobetainyl-CoA:carnitine CoA-transferase CaiB-like acyl-CoA transferase
MSEMLKLPYSSERGFVHKVNIPELGREYSVPGVGFLAGGKNGYVESPPPVLGEHTVEVLKEAGLSDEQISGLQASGVVSIYKKTGQGAKK